MLNPGTLDDAARLLAALQSLNLTLATAESCTGGLIAATLTAIPGSSATVLGGFVTYSNAMKSSVLGVPPGVINAVGAVSEQVAQAMVDGALRRSDADIAVACTGVAGPGGGSETKPVGLVHIAAARRGGASLHIAPVFSGDRTAVRAATVDAAFGLIRKLL